MLASVAMLGFLQNLGMPELIVIALIALLLFGKRLPDVARSVGKGIVEFKKGLHDTGDEIKKSLPSDSDVANGESNRKQISETKKDDGFNKP
jgi:sec-independent protein translocase protein TatA